jgi:hypothetical protein
VENLDQENALPAQAHDTTEHICKDLDFQDVTDQVLPFKRFWSTPTVVEVTCPSRQAA